MTGISYPGGDAVSIAGHTGARTVRSYIAVPGSVAAIAAPLARLGIALGSLPGVRSGMEALVRRGPEGPSEGERARNRWAVMAEATSGGDKRAALASGTDTYGVTARFLALFALRLQGWREAGIEAGFRGPAELVDDPDEFAGAAGINLVRGELRP